jgi:quercetin dioxygenase-like cupin family protein
MHVKTKIKVILGGIAIAGSLVGLAMATPIIDLASPLLAVGQHSADIKTHGLGQTLSGESFEVSLHTEGPATISTQDAAYTAGGINGWHSHPGVVAVTLIAGSIEWFDENCVKTDYNAGDSWTEGSELHYFRVVGKTGIHLNATFITAKGAALRKDESAPACAAALGLE